MSNAEPVAVRLSGQNKQFFSDKNLGAESHPAASADRKSSAGNAARNSAQQMQLGESGYYKDESKPYHSDDEPAHSGTPDLLLQVQHAEDDHSAKHTQMKRNSDVYFDNAQPYKSSKAASERNFEGILVAQDDSHPHNIAAASETA